MSVINVNLEDSYTCKTSNESISLDIIVGDGQVGSTTVFLGLDLIEDPYVLGARLDITGKKATIVTAITDTLDETNWTSVTVVVAEGTNKTTYGPYKKVATANLDTVIYSLQLHFS